MKSRVVVLLSAGLDSSVNLFEAHRQHEVVLALTFNYGQKAAPRELASAVSLCQALKVPHKIVDLTFFQDFQRSSLLMEDQKIPQGEDVDIHSLTQSQKTAQSVWVPNRNGIFLNIAAGFAEALGAEFVIPGFNAEEAATFSDNSEAYMKALDHSFSFSTANQVQVRCFTSGLQKTEIVKKGQSLNLPFDKIWPCYFSGPQWCGQCESCQRSKNAMKQAGLDINEYFGEQV